MAEGKNNCPPARRLRFPKRARMLARMCLARSIALALSAALLAFPARAAMPSDPDWPCMQLKVSELTLASAWGGAPLEPYLESWSANAAVAELARRVAQRRMPPDVAEHDIRAVADAAGPARRETLLAVMAGVFSTLADKRRVVVAGLDQFGRRQKELAGQLRADIATLRGADPAQAAATQQKVEWSMRVFDQRRQALSAACDVPNCIERRLYVIAHIIQPLLD